MTSLIEEVVKAHQREAERWMRITEHWTLEERARVMVGWLGTKHAKMMNDTLEISHAQVDRGGAADPGDGGGDRDGGRGDGPGPGRPREG
jgi:hypothetical protein